MWESVSDGSVHEVEVKGDLKNCMRVKLNVKAVYVDYKLIKKGREIIIIIMVCYIGRCAGINIKKNVSKKTTT